MIRTMTFNIYNWDKKDDHLQRIVSVLRNYTPDTIGTQEISMEWIAKIMNPEVNPDLCALYDVVGEDRADDTHEQCSIFYRKDKFKLIETGTRWMYGNDPQGATVAGRFEGALYNRIFTYAVLECLDNGKQFVQLSLHPDVHNPDSIDESGEDSQTRQVRYALNFCKAMREERGLPVVLTGDFNATVDDATGMLVQSYGFAHTQSMANVIVGEVVENAKYKQTRFAMSRFVDHIWLLCDKPYCRTYTICNQKIFVDGVGEYPSDHLPRIADYNLW